MRNVKAGAAALTLLAALAGSAGAASVAELRDCLFDWAESSRFYPGLFYPADAPTAEWQQYGYRHYTGSNSYLGISALDSHVYYLGPEGVMRDVGRFASWLVIGECIWAKDYVDPTAPNFAPGPEFADEARLWQGIPSVAVAPNGRIWVTWYSGGRRESDPDSPNYVLLFTSGDGGESFVGPVAVVKSKHGGRTFDSNLWIDPAGRLWWYYTEERAAPVLWTTIANITANPGDERPSWQPPRAIAPGVTLNKPTVLANGDWLWPNANWSVNPMAARLSVSHDQGENFSLLSNWHHSRATAPEHMTVERRDGSLLMLVRTADGIVQTASGDGGRSFGPATPLPGIQAPDSRFFIGRLASGRLLLIHNADPKRRVNLTARLSDDDGRTWRGGLLLDGRDLGYLTKDRNISYPDATQAADGTIWVVYDVARYDPQGREIMLARFREEDILLGQVVMPGSRLMMLVDKLYTPMP